MKWEGVGVNTTQFLDTPLQNCLLITQKNKLVIPIIRLNSQTDTEN